MGICGFEIGRGEDFFGELTGWGFGKCTQIILLLVIVVFQLDRLDAAYFFVPCFVKCLCNKNSVGIIVSVMTPI